MDTPLVVMGVAGSGKSVVGRALAARLVRPFVDADDLHDEASVEKMRQGEPLDDSDRRPWLDRVARALTDRPPPVVACSALKRSYRDRLRAAASDVRFVHLDGETSLIAARMAARADHFMPLSLLEDQCATLEPLAFGEAGITVAIDRSVGAIVDDTVARLG